MGKLFGTDGIRGVVNLDLDAQLAFRVGAATAAVLTEETGKARPLVTIGKDTRISSEMLESALVAGLCSAGADVVCLGVMPTPAVAYMTIYDQADAGIVISASHNPFEHNGIKIFNGQGFKLPDAWEDRVEEWVLGDAPLPCKTHGALGRVTRTGRKAAGQYVAHLAGTVATDLTGLRVLVDCANGAASATARILFDHFPALHVDIINADPDGVNINSKCGSTHMEALAAMVTAGEYDLGIAFDGDADRCLAVDERGRQMDGDQMMAAYALDMKAQGALTGNTLVATIMSNIGLSIFAREHEIELVCTDVGDRNVLERMLAEGYIIGGEQSGHMIFLRHATTGDGQLSAVQLIELLCRSGKKASEIAAVCTKYPQVLLNVPVANAAAKAAVMASSRVKEVLEAEEAALRGDGRILLRPSGTEALIRVMVEGKDKDTIQQCAENLVNVIKNL